MRIGKKAQKLEHPENLPEDFEDQFFDELYSFVANDLYALFRLFRFVILHIY